MENNFHELLTEKINLGGQLINCLQKYDKVDGAQKLQRKIKQELNFLKKVSRDQTVKKEHLQCSNLTHFNALIQTLNEIENCQSINKVFNLEGRKISIDIVCDNGLSWVKVIARNPKSLNQICMGDTGYGVRSVIDQAEEYLECAYLHPCLFQTPKITFVFYTGISYTLAAKLESLGIIVKGNRIEHDINDTQELQCSDLSTKNTSHITKINLDVSAMLAYVSSVTNGSCNKYEFSVPVLAQQAKWECEKPVKPILENYFKGKTLYCCETAKSSFIEIVNTVGGPNEKIRAMEFLKQISVLPDNATVQDTQDVNLNERTNNVQLLPSKSLEVGGKIRERSLTIFKFGDRIQAVTVTANDGFIRAAKQQGIHFVVFVHESRALTEQKELKARRIE
ncbi:hypothetical protein RN001_006932 [Aquatica leii]|uniref:DUF1308 domain-containing protein n=1 Tax=Aquatica leii TaxID=1421715 RepID=A0AAN7PEM1_9COLE|nr:hypothetical protein RN001_006932 [Aquatica leii]